MSPAMRRYSGLEIGELEVLAERNWACRPVLDSIKTELEFRKKKPRVRDLLEKINEHLTDSSPITQIIMERRIRYLCHFTSCKNLPGILTHGLLPRHELEIRKLKFIPIDTKRLDRRPECSCLSIGQPNRKLFFKYRELQPGERWVVLLIKATPILTDPRTEFCRMNAASTLSRNERLAGPSGLLELYKPGRNSRRSSRPRSFPTNQQAEVLFPGVIEPNLIERIAVDHPRFVSNIPRAEYLPEYFETDASYSAFRFENANE
jgi:hypothetical protein